MPLHSPEVFLSDKENLKPPRFALALSLVPRAIIDTGDGVAREMELTEVLRVEGMRLIDEGWR